MLQQTVPTFWVGDIVGYFPGTEPSQGSLICPVCASQDDGLGMGVYVHPTVVVVDAGGVVTTVTDQGTAITTNEEPKHHGPYGRSLVGQGRGVRTTLSFGCEAGHAFTLSFQFHKGQTDVETQRDPDRPTDTGPDTIWRA